MANTSSRTLRLLSLLHIMALGVVGANFQVVSPPELIDRIHDWGRRFSQAGEPARRAEPAYGPAGPPAREEPVRRSAVR